MAIKKTKARVAVVGLESKPNLSSFSFLDKDFDLECCQVGNESFAKLEAFDQILLLAAKPDRQVLKCVKEISNKNNNVILLLPKVDRSFSVKDAFGQYCEVLFKPCTKSSILKALNSFTTEKCNYDYNYRLMLENIIEFSSSSKGFLYVLYNRLYPMIGEICDDFEVDITRMFFSSYVLLLYSIEDECIRKIIEGENRSDDGLLQAYEHIQKFYEILSLSDADKTFVDSFKYILKYKNGEGIPRELEAEHAPYPSKVVRLLLDYNYQLSEGKSAGQALYWLHKHKERYDFVYLERLVDSVGSSDRRFEREIYPLGLVEGMEVAQDVFGVINGNKKKLISKNEILTKKTISIIQSYCDGVLDPTEPIIVYENLT